MNGEAAPSTGPARRRTPRRKAERPAELLDAAFAEFAARGYAAARLDDIAERAGVVKGTIYRYFADKQALFEAVVASRVSTALGDLAGIVDAFPGSTRDLVELAVTSAHRMLRQSELPVFLRILVAEGANFPALPEAYYRETVAKGRALIERIVARGVARGEVRPGPAADLAIVVMAPAIMAAVWEITFQRFAPIPAERFRAAHLDLVLNGLLVEPPRARDEARELSP
jgi:AcrR family transcriptional regulator